MKANLIHILLILFLFACEEATDWELDTRNHDLIVVESQITNELKRHTVKLSRTIGNINQQPEPVSGALVAVQSGDSVAVFSEYPAGSGIYYSDSLQAVVNRTYLLCINYEGDEFTASAEMVPVTPLKALSYRLADEVNNLYEINYQDSNEPSIKEYWISWGHLPAYQDLPQEETLARVFHYTLSSIDVNQVFSPEKEKVRFPAGAVVLRKKYSLSDEHQAFLRAFLSETEWRGSVFDVQKGNVLTNLSEGAIGYFAVSTVVSDTTLIIP